LASCNWEEESTRSRHQEFVLSGMGAWGNSEDRTAMTP
jgi:hypothetical protein